MKVLIQRGRDGEYFRKYGAGTVDSRAEAHPYAIDDPWVAASCTPQSPGCPKKHLILVHDKEVDL